MWSFVWFQNIILTTIIYLWSNATKNIHTWYIYYDIHCRYPAPIILSTLNTIYLNINLLQQRIINIYCYLFSFMVIGLCINERKKTVVLKLKVSLKAQIKLPRICWSCKKRSLLQRRDFLMGGGDSLKIFILVLILKYLGGFTLWNST